MQRVSRQGSFLAYRLLGERIHWGVRGAGYTWRSCEKSVVRDASLGTDGSFGSALPKATDWTMSGKLAEGLHAPDSPGDVIRLRDGRLLMVFKRKEEAGQPHALAVLAVSSNGVRLLSCPTGGADALSGSASGLRG
mmetsp:Transcript_6350/g.17762  ORF Transcript_6350/g.17762 Transcript_6350/m.17762 type:complete len:136 (-) Transcript_6350:156-563(-)